MPARLSSSVGVAPPADRFPRYPASWYLLGASTDIAKRPVSKHMLGRRIVAFRTASGTAVVMDGSCAHLGADLGCGKVVGETIQCPFHGWRYGADGACAGSAARLQVYPVVERHGYLFFFNGREAQFPLPFFWAEDPQQFVAGKIFSYVADCNWYMNAAHAFDTQHFASVHDRELLAPPEVDYPAPFARRNSYHAKVIGQHFLDRLLYRFAGKTVRITISVCGGTIMLVTGNFGGAHSRFIIAAEPLENGQTLCQGICYARSSGFAPLNRLSLAIRRIFTHGYLAAETREIRGTQYRPESLGANDRDLIEFFQWMAHHANTALGVTPAPVPAAVRAVAGARD